MKNPLWGAPVPGLEPCKPLLDTDPLLYLDLTEGVRRGIGTVLHASPAGALVAFPGDEGDNPGYTMVCADGGAARALCGLLPKEFNFLVTTHDEFAPPVLRERYGPAFRLGNPCFQAAYLADKPFSLPPDGPDIRPLERRYLPQAAETYHMGSAEYLEWLIDREMLFGAFEGETLLAFIGCHAEGSMGILEVLPPYRRRGLGALLEQFLINRELSLGHIPYCQVFSDNTPSLALQRKLGLTLSAATLRWASPD